ncbi:hypothetical protein AARAC_010483 [Aspergillus arachidicola]|uniref:Uncharacterized protein n=1 Tax=Aspergillus arachidicola TaxID=656916 RepID=A0A2G7G8B6_9EURO|nr:hypothetical protein AARAC_010483 [Aspergillus arachidicola]
MSLSLSAETIDRHSALLHAPSTWASLYHRAGPSRLESQGWTAINKALLHKILRLSILQQTSSPINFDSKTPLRPTAVASQRSHLTVLKNAGLWDVPKQWGEPHRASSITYAVIHVGLVATEAFAGVDLEFVHQL